MAGSYEVYDAAFRRAGIVRVDEILDLFNCASVLDSRYLPGGPRIALITNAGGPGVIAADAVKGYGCELAQLSEKTIADLDSSLPSYWSHGNPVDLLGDADVERFARAVTTCLADPAVDGIVVVYTPQGSATPTELAERVVAVAEKRIKPILTVWMGEHEVRAGREVFHSKNIPTYASPEVAIRTYMYMWRYKRNLDLLNETPEELSVAYAPPSSHVRLLAERALQEGKIFLTEDKADRFLDAYGIPRAKGILCTSVEQASSAASSVGYPVVLKIVSPDIIHKVDAGGVITGVKSEAELRAAFTRLLDRVRRDVATGSDRRRVCPENDRGRQLRAHSRIEEGPGLRRSHTVWRGRHNRRGLQGLLDEASPLNQTLARRLIEDTKIWEILRSGVRNRPPADIRLLEEIVIKFSNLVVDFPEIAENRH